MSFLYNEFIFRPLINLLFFVYNTIAFSDAGVAILLFTIIVRVLIFPLFYKNMRYQLVMQKLQPEVVCIQKELKDEKEKQVKAMIDVYAKHKINPFSGFVFIIVQVTLLIALYQISMTAFDPKIAFSYPYSFVHIALPLGHTFLGFFDISVPYLGVAILAGILQFLQSRYFMPQTATGDAAQMMKTMNFIFPLLTLTILVKLPAVVGLYWVASSLFSMGEYIVTKKLMKE
ncbi:MAG: membrane protein insertase YidC [Parcubacteria group bacterium]|nr:membrane protein insertase YidC [Parcubacteria group bacterium]